MDTKTTTFIDVSLLINNGWDDADSFSEGRARVKKNGRYGYISAEGDLVIQCIWKTADPFSEGLAVVGNDQDEFFFIDKLGNVVLSFEVGTCPYVRGGGFHEGLALVRHNQKYGFINNTGHMVIPCVWEDADPFEDGLASVRDNNEKYGCIDLNGRVVIPFNYEEDIVFREGIACVHDAYDNYFIDKKGNRVFDLGFDCGTACFKEGVCSIEEFGFIDMSGKTAIENKWSPEWEGFSEGLAPTEEGYIDHSGRVVITGDWDEWYEFKEGLAPVVKDGRYGFIDHSGRIVIPCIWSYAAPFSGGLACVKIAEKYYYIDKQGKLLCTFTRKTVT
ncbi:MAG: WG repeat-containing protein [Bacteroidales bacterium]|nr:WG repeat-containing protein [Bacteroidales bacterium]